MNRYLLEMTVFLCGAVVMIFEIVGSRVLAPYFGTSTFVWTSLIGIILGSLSVGYWLGGKASDNNPQCRILSLVIFFGAVAIGVMTLSKDIILRTIESEGMGIRSGSVIGSILLFFPASMLLGMVSPYAVRLRLKSLEQSGATIGNLYAISTIGSIMGTFLAGFYLIPMFGTNKILFLLSFILVGFSIMLFQHHLLALKVLVFVIALAGYGFGMNPIFHFGNKPNLADVDTEYSRVSIYDDTGMFGSNVRLMRINNEYSSGMFLGNEDLVFEYTKYYRLAKHFRKDIENTLMIGGAGYSYPKDFLKEFERAQMDIVEIDPGLTLLARQYFGLKNDSRLRIYHEDGRTYLNRNKKEYDVIFGDAFKSQYSLPYQLTTREAVNKMYSALKSDGVLILNTISAVQGSKGEFLRAERATYESVFPQVYLFLVQNPERGDFVQNVVLVALKSQTVPSFESSDAELNGYLKHLWKGSTDEDMPVLTDDYAPVDYYINKTI